MYTVQLLMATIKHIPITSLPIVDTPPAWLKSLRWFLYQCQVKFLKKVKLSYQNSPDEFQFSFED